MGKAQFTSIFNWQTTSPVTGFLPAPGPGQDVAGNSPKNGILAGAFTGAQTVYTNILGLQQMDGEGIELTWTGNPTGTLSIMCSNSGINFYPLTFSPTLTQPTGSALGYLIQLDPVTFRYIFLQYDNTNGTGTITAYSQCKANNR